MDLMQPQKRGQGALEYLLLLGGAVLIAAVVITLLFGIGSQGQGVTNQQAQSAFNTIESGIAGLGLGGGGGGGGPSAACNIVIGGGGGSLHIVNYTDFPSGQATNVASSANCGSPLCDSPSGNYTNPNGDCLLFCATSGPLNVTISNGTETANCSDTVP